MFYIVLTERFWNNLIMYMHIQSQKIGSPNNLSVFSSQKLKSLNRIAEIDKGIYDWEREFSVFIILELIFAIMYTNNLINHITAESLTTWRMIP